MARYLQEDVFYVVALNAENEKIKVAIDDLLSRKGDGPNAMEDNIDMNGYTLNNLPAPVSDLQPVNKAYADANYGGGSQFADAAEASFDDTVVVYNDTLTLYNDFFDVWKGPSAVPPTGTFDVGDLYYNTADELIKVWNGASWISAYAISAETFTNITVDSIKFSGSGAGQGVFSWNADEETVDLTENGTTLQLGQEIHRHVRNSTGATITNGTPVMFAGTIGGSGKVTIEPMVGSDPASYIKFLGMATEDIASGADGKISVQGKVRGINTTAYAEGDELWVSTATAGAVTNVKPTSGLKILVGYVVSSAVNGTISLNTLRGARVDELHDVVSTGRASGDILSWNGSSYDHVDKHRETVYTLSGTAISPANGTIQTKTLTANTTFTESLSSGDSVTLMINDGTGFTVTWPTISWVGGTAPTLETTGENVIVIWKVGSTLYGLFVGAA